MTFQPKDHDQFFRAYGANRVRRALVNGELKGVSADKAKMWLAGRPDWVSRWMLIATVAGIAVSAVVALVVGAS